MKNKENKKESSLNIDLTKENIWNTRSFIKKFLKKGIKNFQLNVVNPDNKALIIPLDELLSFASNIRYAFLDKALIKIIGLPYCLIPEPEGFIFKSQKGDFLKNKNCRHCKFFLNCLGLPRFYYNKQNIKKIMPQKLPEEIAVELSSNSNSSFSLAELKKIISQAAGLGASIFRVILFDQWPEKYNICELLKFAKSKNLQTRLDMSNIETKKINFLFKNIGYLVDYSIIYINYKDIGKEKEKELSLLRAANIKIIRVVTPAIPVNIKNLWKIYRFILKCQVDKWAVNRNVTEKDINRNEIKILIERLFKIKKDIKKRGHPLRAHIVYPIPFCADNPLKVNFVCTGAKSVDGYERLLIDKNGAIKPIHYFDKKIGDFRDIFKAWNSSFLKSLRFYKFLPNDCKKCPFLEKCKGGSRFCAYQFYGSYKAPDPLMNFSNIKKYIF
jgi:radical SAM protein with 4Fe4S-binding SPASM domain